MGQVQPLAQDLGSVKGFLFGAGVHMGQARGPRLIQRDFHTTPAARRKEPLRYWHGRVYYYIRVRYEIYPTHHRAEAARRTHTRTSASGGSARDGATRSSLAHTCSADRTANAPSESMPARTSRLPYSTPIP